MNISDSIEYHFLPVPFTVLTLCGTWYPENWSKKAKKIYKCFTATVLILGIILFLETFANVVLTIGTDRFNLENVFAINVFAIGIFKKINIINCRQEVIEFFRNYVDHEWYKPQNLIEAIICKRIASETRRVSLIYAIFIGIALLLRSITPIIEARTLIILPIEVWCPYSVNTLVIFWLTYFHQIISGVTLTCMHLCTDTLLVGLLLQMSCQLRILKNRLRNFGNNNPNMLSKEYNEIHIKTTIIQRVQEHESIYRFGYDLQKTFKPILIGQMVVVIPNFIINIYVLSVHTDRFNLKYFMTIFFALVPTMQIYMFCWYGNQIFLGSTNVGDALYECNWTTFNKSTKKILLTIITRTSKSILITAGAVIPLNLDSFIQIMKTSYSAFNLLQQTVNH